MPQIELTEEQIAELIQKNAPEPQNLTKDGMVGQFYFFRTVTWHIVGRVVGWMGEHAILEDATWVASSGRFSKAIANGKVDEAEYIGNWAINLDTVTDWGPWKHAKLETV